ncbi:glutamate receptor ionotropic, delta-1 [Caerostris extrusa]|uniref:Glutamate receptor ionotropic, delta-1 n=1 Tax=Caerostris extrusa TaxID=172846 RepID=A0AAV4RW50_CAEEX|nr:glutamate receptor ionotropic, delta-1 [Caerostris extrusa]
MLMALSYSTTVLSFLTIPWKVEYPKNFFQLSHAVKEGTYRSFTLKGASMLSVLQKSSQEYFQFLGKIIENNEWYYERKDIESLKDNVTKIAFIGTRYKLHLLRGALKLKSYAKSRDHLITFNIAIALRKDFCCKGRLNTIISRIKSAGLYSRLEKLESGRAWHKSKSMFHKAKQHCKPLSIHDLFGVYISLLTGYMISFIALLLEIIHFKIYGRFSAIVSGKYKWIIK